MTAIRTCSAGEGESCNHIAALLYAVVDISDKKKEGSHASTSSKCKSNMPRKRKLSPKRSQDLVFKKYKFSDSEPTIFSPKEPKRLDSLDHVTPVNINQFCERLKKCAPNAAFLLTTEQTEKNVEEQQTNLESFHDINLMFSDKTNISSENCTKYFENYFDSLSISEDQCMLIAKLTKGQSRNPLWQAARHGRITSSDFGLVFKRKDKTPQDNLLKRILSYETFDNEKVRWGRSHEPAARRIYRKVVQQTHPNLKVHCCGLLVKQTYAASWN